MNKNITICMFITVTAVVSLTKLNGMEPPINNAQIVTAVILNKQLEQAAEQLDGNEVTRLLYLGAKPQPAMIALQRMTRSRQLSPEDLQKCNNIYAQLERSFALSIAIEREHDQRVAVAAARHAYKG